MLPVVSLRLKRIFLRLTGTESDVLGGLLGDTGFLDGINLADYAEKRHFQEMIEGGMRRIPGCSPYNYVELPWYSAGYSNDPSNGNSFLKKYPKELRVQACCDWWLARARNGKDIGIICCFIILIIFICLSKINKKVFD